MDTLTYSQKVGPWLLKQSGCSLQDYCIKFGYDPCLIKIMNLDENDEKKSKQIIARDKELKKLYIESANDKYATSRKGSNRSWTQYFKDLITGWILENIVVEMLRAQGIDARLNGADAKRVIRIGKNVSQEEDLLIRVGDVCRKVELIHELNPILEKEGFIEKRAPALFKLWQDKAILLYRDLSRGKYILVDFGSENVTLHLRHHNTVKNDFSKDVHRYVLSENGKMERDDRLLAPELISVVGCNIDGKEQPELIEIEDEDSPPQVFTVGGKFREKKTNKAVPVQKQVEKVVVEPKNTKVERKPEQPSVDTHTEQSEELAPTEETEEEIVENQIDIDYGDSDFV